MYLLVFDRTDLYKITTYSLNYKILTRFKVCIYSIDIDFWI